MKVPNIQIKKILCATDLSKTAVHAFSLCGQPCQYIYGASITILHVLAEFPGEKFILNMINAGTWEEIKMRHYSVARDKLNGMERDHIAIKEVLQAFSEEVNTSAKDQTFVTDEILIKNGAPAEIILQTAKEQNCDLIVMGTHGQGVIADVLMPSELP